MRTREHIHELRVIYKADDDACDECRAAQKVRQMKRPTEGHREDRSEQQGLSLIHISEPTRQ